LVTASVSSVAERVELPHLTDKPQVIAQPASIAEEHPVKDEPNKAPAALGALHLDHSSARTPVQAGDTRSAKYDAGDEESDRSAAKSDPAQEQLPSRSLDRENATAQNPPTDSVANPTSLEPTSPEPTSLDGVEERAGSTASLHGAAIPSSRRPDAPAIEGTPAPAMSRPAAAEATVHQTPAEDRATALQHGSSTQVNHAAAAIQDGSNPALERNPAGERGLGAPASNQTGEVSGAGARTNTQETFSALDAEPAQGASTWIHAGPQHAEAGFQDPSLGWVGVRADLGGSGIHAALVPGSGEAAQVLGSQMAGLNAYLTEHHTPVETLTLASAGSHGNDSLMEQGSNQSPQQGSGQGSGQDSNADPYFNTGRSAAAISPAASVGNRTQVFAESTAAQRSMPSGATISLMA
jgi:hypothetical protein